MEPLGKHAIRTLGEGLEVVRQAKERDTSSLASQSFDPTENHMTRTKQVVIKGGRGHLTTDLDTSDLESVTPAQHVQYSVHEIAYELSTITRQSTKLLPSTAHPLLPPDAQQSVTLRPSHRHTTHGHEHEPDQVDGRTYMASVEEEAKTPGEVFRETRNPCDSTTTSIVAQHEVVVLYLPLDWQAKFRIDPGASCLLSALLEESSHTEYGGELTQAT
ncbi:hypothetical protein BJ875DRAFT_442176 [Amylocarpus encephaloides]|uniref:Uncharacterized protein n=1 Tax=Amylocarpus encephaloides TaxID=45428 RepID=A0A9P8C4I3_9HELO|nr:hypothetical protein BJ875DRAFT_442176 [Amylocarpus encephaloides]